MGQQFPQSGSFWPWKHKGINPINNPFISLNVQFPEEKRVDILNHKKSKIVENVYNQFDNLIKDVTNEVIIDQLTNSIISNLNENSLIHIDKDFPKVNNLEKFKNDKNHSITM